MIDFLEFLDEMDVLIDEFCREKGPSKRRIPLRKGILKVDTVENKMLTSGFWWEWNAYEWFYIEKAMFTDEFYWENVVKTGS